MIKKKILIISNDSLYIKKNIVSSDYNDTVNIIESIINKQNTFIYSRTSIYVKNFYIKSRRYNFKKFSFLDLINKKNFKIFMISITPFNFFSFIVAKTFNKKINGYVYLRSDGIKEYHYKYGYIGKLIYFLMLKIITSFLKTVSVSNNISNIPKKTYLVNPSEITNDWLKNRKKPKLDKPRLLYLGRFKKEKGIHSLIKLINLMSDKLELKIVGIKKKSKLFNQRIKFYSETNSEKKIINYYDSCNIFILPSYTEGAPKVILESLSRLRPVIVFEEIEHVKRNFYGIFVCKRNSLDLKKKINFIMNNYFQISENIRKNRIATKKEFQKKLSKII